LEIGSRGLEYKFSSPWLSLGMPVKWRSHPPIFYNIFLQTFCKFFLIVITQYYCINFIRDKFLKYNFAKINK